MRVSRPVLRGPAGVTPAGYSPTGIAGMPQRGRKADLAGRCLQGHELSVARMVPDGRGAETYRTSWLVEFNWIGVVMTVAARWR